MKALLLAGLLAALSPKLHSKSSKVIDLYAPVGLLASPALMVYDGQAPMALGMASAGVLGVAGIFRSFKGKEHHWKAWTGGVLVGGAMLLHLGYPYYSLSQGINNSDQAQVNRAAAAGIISAINVGLLVVDARPKRGKSSPLSLSPWPYQGSGVVLSYSH